MVTRRRYRQSRRAERSADTERRIVEATFAVHDEQGISATSVRDIAERAGVAPSTVLHHFPRMDDLVRACGALSQQLLPMPDEAVLVGTTGTFERVARMARAMFEWWDRMGPGFDHLRVDRRRIPEVDAWMSDLARRHGAFADAALSGAGDRRRDLLVALTGADAWTTLRSSGIDPTDAARDVARLLAGVPPTKETVQ